MKNIKLGGIMRDLTNKKAMIIKVNSLTIGEECTISRYCEDNNKWEVSFEGTWVGWYAEDELLIHGDMPSLYYSY